MGQILHGSAQTAAAVRLRVQRSQERLSRRSERFDLNPKTVAKWKKRKHIQDTPMEPKQPRSTVLTPEEEATVVAFRKYTLLPLDDCLYALQASISHLTRSSLHRCLVRHGIHRLSATDAKKSSRKTFKHYPLGYVHIDLAEVRTEEGKRYLCVAIDRTSKLAYTDRATRPKARAVNRAELHPSATKLIAAQFLRNLNEAMPYQRHTVLTDNGIQFTNRKKIGMPSSISSTGCVFSMVSSIG